MILHNEPSYKICFGDKKDCCVKSYHKFKLVDAPKEVFEDILKTSRADKLVFSKQEHSNHGLCLKDESEIPDNLTLFKTTGDYLITSLRHVAIGVFTADCLSIVFYDPVKNVVGIAHGGWKGLVAGIISNVIQDFQDNFNSKPSDIVIYFGPSAKVCCYQVADDFSKNLEKYSFFEQTIFKKENGIFFNLPLFAKLQLLQVGIKENNINQNYNDCTICGDRFFSFRRDGSLVGHQVTIVVLK